MQLLQSPSPLRFHHYPPSLFLSSPLKISVSPKNLNQRTNQHQFSVACRSSNYFDQQRFSAATTPPAYPPQPPGGSPSRVFVGYSIYKGKAALTVEPRAPEFTPLDSGAYKMSKEGIILLQFAPAVAARQYDWNRKQVFSLSVAEIGTLLTLGLKDSCEFFHDPFKGRSLSCHTCLGGKLLPILLNPKTVHAPTTRHPEQVLLWNGADEMPTEIQKNAAKLRCDSPEDFWSV